jgi:hypothetical protein
MTFMRRLLLLGLAATFLVTGCKSSSPTEPPLDAPQYNCGAGLTSLGWLGGQSLSTANAGAEDAPDIGDTLHINVATSCDEGSDIRVGVVKAVSAHSIIVVDENNPASGLGDADWQRFATEFDQHAYPAVVEAFGEPSDVDRPAAPRSSSRGG